MGETWRGTWVISYRELLRFVQQRSRMFSSFGQPLLFLVIFGAGFNNVIGQLTPGVDFLKFMYPGIVAMTVLMTAVFSGLSVVWDREFGFLKEVLVAPISRTGIVLGKAVGGSIIAMIQGLILLILAPVVGVDLSGAIVAALIPLLIVISLSLSSLGILIASRMRSQQSFQVVMQVLILPMIFLSGVFFPLNQAPGWLSFLSKINPITYGVDAVRRIFLDGTIAAPPGGQSPLGVTVLGHTMSTLEDALLVAAIGVILLLLAVFSFSRQD